MRRKIGILEGVPNLGSPAIIIEESLRMGSVIIVRNQAIGKETVRI